MNISHGQNFFSHQHVLDEMGWSFHHDGTLPENTEVFVFGSNLAGIHEAGAAAVAFADYGAVMFKGSGLMGNSYAIPTKHRNYQYRLTLPEIQAHVERFCEFTRKRHDLKFFVTSVGCGYSRYTPSQIAPMFRSAINCNFPKEWMPYLLGTT